MVFIVSAYMHGISTGYYAFFLQLAVLDYVQKRYAYGPSSDSDSDSDSHTGSIR